MSSLLPKLYAFPIALVLTVACSCSRTGDSVRALGTPAHGNLERVRFIGRVDRSDPVGKPRLSWAGTRMIVRFRGDSLRITLTETNLDRGPSGYDVLVDGKQTPNTFVPREGNATYDIVSGLSPADQPHVVELYRRTEAMVGVTQIESVLVPKGEVLAPDDGAFNNRRRIEFLGDSESTGYGVECHNAEENFTGATENERKAYPALVGKRLNAESYNISYSGKGLFRNQDDDPTGLFAADFYVRSNPMNASSRWTFSSWQPHVVWISLGANDWDPGDKTKRSPPAFTEFKTHYKALVELVRTNNPSAHIVCAVPGMVNDEYPAGFHALTNIKTALKQVVDERRASGDQKIAYHEHPRAKESDLTGCNFHPNAAYHQVVASSVAARIAELMGWR